MRQFAAVVLAGGEARRLGGVVKPLIPVGGRPMLARVLDATASARPRIVVGPPELAPALPEGVRLVQEDPPGGGPVAAIAAAVRLLPPDTSRVAVLSGDLPFLTPAVLSDLAERLTGRLAGRLTERLTERLAGADEAADDGPHEAQAAVLLDGSGRPQWLCSMWRRSALDRRLDAIGPPAGVRVRDLVGDTAVLEVRVAAAPGPPPWFDCDTDSDIRQAEEWIDADS
jgi:molybdopterin-guanine dinucleotide biosynthesis protein A